MRDEHRFNIDHSIELICSHGCKAVWHDIERLEQGVGFDEVSGLTVAERDQVLVELRHIMAVYASRCGLD